MILFDLKMQTQEEYKQLRNFLFKITSLIIQFRLDPFFQQKQVYVNPGQINKAFGFVSNDQVKINCLRDLQKVLESFEGQKNLIIEFNLVQKQNK